MRGYRNVLVPLDFSDVAGKVFEAAVRVLAPDGRATLLHVVEWMPVVTEGTFGVYAHRKDIDRLVELSRAKLDEFVREHPDLALDAEVHEGKPSQVILEAADRLAPDVIVMGTHSRSTLDQLFIGSVAERVLRKAKCSVLAVRV